MTAVIVAAVVLTLRRGLQAADVLVGARVPVDPDRGVFDAELLSKHRFDALDHGACFLVHVGANVQRGHRAPGGELPHVNVADGRQARHGAHQALLHLLRRSILRRAFQQDVDRLGEQLPCAAQDQRRHQDRQDGIDRRPAREVDDDRSDDGADRAEQVAHHVQDGPLHVDVIGLSAGHDPQHEHVHQQAEHGDDHHRAGQDHGRRLQPLPRLVGDPSDDREQGHGVQETGDDLEAQVAEGALAVGRAAAEPECCVGQCERRGVGQHVARVGQQGQRARQHASDGLHDHEAEDQEKGQQDLALVGAGHGRGVVMIMVVIVTMVMCVGLGHGASGNWVFDCGSKYNT